MCFLVKYRDEKNSLQTVKSQRLERNEGAITIDNGPEELSLREEDVVQILELDDNLSETLLKDKVRLEEYIKMTMPLYRE